MSTRRFPFEVEFLEGDTLQMRIEIFDVHSDAERPNRRFLTVDLDLGQVIGIEGEITDVVTPVKEATDALGRAGIEHPLPVKSGVGPEFRRHVAPYHNGTYTQGEFHRSTIVTETAQRTYTTWLNKGGSQEKLLKDLEANSGKPTLPEGSTPTPPGMRR